MDFIKVLSSTQKLESEDTIWAFSFESVNISIEIEELNKICDDFVLHNSSTGNMALFIVYISSLVKNMAHCLLEGQYNYVNIHNKNFSIGLYLFSLVFSKFMSICSTPELRTHCNLSPLWPETSFPHCNDKIFEVFISDLIDIIVSNNVRNSFVAYDAQFHSLNILLVFISSHVYKPVNQMEENCLFTLYLQRSMESHLRQFYKMNNGDIESVLPVRLMISLIKFASDTNLPPHDTVVRTLFSKAHETENNQANISSIASLFDNLVNRLKSYVYKYNASIYGDNNGGASPLANASIVLLIDLLNMPSLSNRNQSQFKSNIFREILGLIKDKYDNQNDYIDVNLPNNFSAHVIRYNFSSLSKMLLSVVSSECYLLLLYTLLYVNSHFLEFLIQKNILHKTFESVLKTLYESNAGGYEIQYVCIVCLVILTRDEPSCMILNSNIVSVGWYKSRYLSSISLSNLALLSLQSTFMSSIKREDNFLFLNCIAIFQNISHYCTNLHPYLCEKLIYLLCRLCDQLKLHPTYENPYIIESILEICRFICCSLTKKTYASNVNLIYAILRDFERLTLSQGIITSLIENASSNHVDFQVNENYISLTNINSQMIEILNVGKFNICRINKQFSTYIVSSAETMTKYLQLAIEKSDSQNEPYVTQSYETQYSSYEESSSSILHFFTPLSWWITVQNTPYLFWEKSKIQLFETLDARQRDSFGRYNSNESLEKV